MSLSLVPARQAQPLSKRLAQGYKASSALASMSSYVGIFFGLTFFSLIFGIGYYFSVVAYIKRTSKNIAENNPPTTNSSTNAPVTTGNKPSAEPLDASETGTASIHSRRDKELTSAPSSTAVGIAPTPFLCAPVGLGGPAEVISGVANTVNVISNVAETVNNVTSSINNVADFANSLFDL
jgi:hypothetical protein